MSERLLIVHGGAPTAVMNASLYGAITEAKRHGLAVFGAISGTAGILREDFLDLGALPEEQLRALPATPASAIGTSRDHLEPADYEAIAKMLRRHGFRYLLANGGNGTMDTCGKIRAAAGEDILVAGIPKTIDNDIAVTDHAPGYGSAARYLAATVGEICLDVRSLPIHVCIVEAMGRNAGWLAAASALAHETGCGPDLIYLPERPFDAEDFLARVERLHKEQGGVVVVVSEGLHDRDGKPVAKPVFEAERSVYYGDVGAELAALVIRRLGIKARSEKPGIAGRCSMAWQSSLDRDEAAWMGREAVQAVVSGKGGVMPGLRRLPGQAYAAESMLIPIEDVMLHERTLPDEFITADGCGVTEAFTAWARPLLGDALPVYTKLG